ncbi:MAG: triose-phosphate isomerase [Bacteroidales bacterium]|nr:triose-phosphate isomerase [Bacteroidales bacterium]
MRKKIVAGNWKMNKTLQEGMELGESLNNYLKNSNPEPVEVVLCTPSIHLAAVTDIVDNNIIKTGAQNCSEKESGAYTGEISASMIKSAGAAYVILGHSERRAYFMEDDNLLCNKTITALENELKVIFCCGEVLAERENQNHFQVVRRQLENGLFSLTDSQFSNIVIAYEPVWAIGTGVTATSQQAQEMHQYIRGLVEEKYGKTVAEETTILYGGSCNAGNAAELFSLPDVDGGLIGGASLKSDAFCKIIESF